LKKQNTSTYFARTLARKSFFCKIAKKFKKIVFHPFSFFLLNAQFLCLKKYFYYFIIALFACSQKWVMLYLKEQYLKLN